MIVAKLANIIIQGVVIMIVTSTEMQNNFGKYLNLAVKEDIIITKNGRTIAVLKSYEDKHKVKEDSAAYHAGRKRVTYEEFLKITEESNERYEYIDGELYLLVSPKTTHQKTLMELSGIFYNFFKGKKCTPMMSPYDIRLKKHEKDINVVQPDLMVICDLEENLGEDDYYHGIPTLVVEIISDSTRSKDYIRKLDLYMSCGVQEYWIVDPLNHQIHVYFFNDKDIKTNRTYTENDMVASFCFKDLTLKAKDIFLL